MYMDTFYIVIVVISSIVLFCVGILMYFQFSYEDKVIFPYVETDCPDNWKIHPDGSCIIPPPGRNTGTMQGKPIYMYNIGNKLEYTMLESIYNMTIQSEMKGELYPDVLGYYSVDIPHGYDTDNPQINRVDFTDLGWDNYGSSLCEKRKWARIKNIAWDGVTNYNGCGN